MKLANWWKFEPDRTPHDFVEENMIIYSQQYLEEYPNRAHMINDWDTEQVIFWMVEEHLEELKSDMADCYYERLGENWD